MKEQPLQESSCLAGMLCAESHREFVDETLSFLRMQETEFYNHFQSAQLSTFQTKRRRVGCVLRNK